MTAPAPPSFERFEILGQLGAGGMGIVYEALDRRRGARVALKMLSRPSADALLRLKHEFRALADLDHPNLVALGELVEERGQWCFTMELVDGVDFIAWTARPGERVAAPSSESMAYGDTMAPAPATRAATDPAAAPGPPRAPAAIRPMVCDEERLRPALMQLARGVAALHAAGMVHRDIKPSNVRVTPQGRVVLLDFGLVAALGQEEHDRDRVAGTATYMAPEQAAGRPLGPEADWYAVGVMVYEALTGRAPFSGAPLEVLMAKQRWEPPPPRALASGVPSDLDALAHQLLRMDPERRPTGREVLARLGATDEAPRAAGSWPTGSAPFVGRRVELAAMEAAFGDARDHAVTVLVEGASGVGKSTVVREAIARMRAASPMLVHLAGRCYPRETVPYKLFDGVIDALARELRRRPAPEVAAMLPRPGLLAQAFPVLRGLAPPEPAPTGAPEEQRAQLHQAVRELLARVAAEGPVVVTLDDLQWADGDSLALLASVLAPPAPPLLALATWRDDAAAGDVTRPALRGDVRRLPLGNLPPEEAEALAAAAGCDAESARRVAAEAEGHPLFIDTLARRAEARAAGVRLDDAIWQGVGRLDPAARSLLEIAAIAGGPVPEALLVRAGDAEPAEAWRGLAALRAGRFVRGGGPGAEQVEPYHDRVREAVLSRLEPERKARRHEALARVLEAEPAADAESLAFHWREAGVPARAAEHAVAAARRAGGALAFERAARLYQLALELGAPPGRGLESLHTALAEALAAVGRGPDAARAYLAAAGDAPRAEALELKRRAAETLLKGGHFDAGVDLLGDVLAAEGLRLPRSPGRALVSLLLGRARVALSGLGFRERDAGAIPPDELRRIDVCWSATVCLGVVDHVLGADIQTRHLRLALRAGEPLRVARALAVEAGFRATTGPRGADEGMELAARAEALAEKTGVPEVVGVCRAIRTLIRYQALDLRAVVEWSDRSLPYLRERCTGVTWEVALVHYYEGMALGWMGRLRELRARLDAPWREAHVRADLHARWCTGVPLHVARLAAGAEPEARAEMDALLAAWSQKGFHIQHEMAHYALAQAALYRGDGAGALAIVEAVWPALERSLLLRLPINSLIMQDLRGRAAVAAAFAAPAGGEARARAVAIARKAQAAMRRAPALDFRDPAVGLVEGRLALLAGARDDGAALLDRAAAGFERIDMRLFAAAARHAAVDAAPSDARRAAWRDAESLLTAEGVAAPEYFLRVWL